MVLATAFTSSPSEPYRLVFFGDSITEEGNAPGGYVDILRNALSKSGQITVIGAGISGNKVPDLQLRLERDVLPHAPAIVVIYIGINDVWHNTLGLQGTPLGTFETGLRDIVKRINEIGARIILCTPSVIGEKSDGSNMHDRDLDQYANVTRNIASTTGNVLCDLRRVFIQYLQEVNTSLAESGILTRDGVHLNDRGNALVAETLLPMLSSAGSGDPPRR